MHGDCSVLCIPGEPPRGCASCCSRGVCYTASACPRNTLCFQPRASRVLTATPQSAGTAVGCSLCMFRLFSLRARGREGDLEKISQRSLLAKTVGAKCQTHQVLRRGRDTALVRLWMLPRLRYFGKAAVLCWDPGLGSCAGCGDTVEGDGWFCAVGSEQEQPMRSGQCWFNPQCIVLSQLRGAIFQECGLPSSSASKADAKGAAGWQRQQQRPRWGCCCCSGSDLGSNGGFTLWDVSREGVVYLKHPGRRRNLSWASVWKRIC